MSAATCSSIGVGVSLLGMPPPLVGQLAGLHPHWWKPAGKGGQGVRRLVQGVMRLLRPTHVAFVAVLLLAACGDDSGSTSEPVLCEEPEFIAGLEPDWMPCGCNEDGSPWRETCLDAGNVCGGGAFAPHGDTCSPKCAAGGVGECPDFMGRALECYAGLCQIACAGGCPERMYCAGDFGCRHDFTPKD